MNFLKCKISRVLALYIVLFSSIITLLLTLVQLRLDYNYGVTVIQQQLDQIKITSIEAISQSIWTVDENQITLQLEGLSRLPDIIYAELVDSNMQLIATAGNLDTDQVIQKSYALIKKHRNIETRLGTLRVVATKENVYQRLIDTALVILISQAVKTFAVTLFMLFIFNYLVTRHLSYIADFLEKFNIKHRPDLLQLDRTVPKIQRGDELDRVINSINLMTDENHRRYAELKDSQQKLTESEARFSTIFNTLSDSVIVFDVHENVLFVNPAFIRQFQYDDDEIPEDIDVLFEHSHDDKNHHANYSRVIENSLGEVIEYRFVRKDQSVFDAEISSSKIILPSGELVAYLSIVRDITRRKQNEDEKIQLMNELQQAQKMESIGLLVGGIAHDFNNILGSIIGYSELASELIPEDQPVIQRYLSSVISSGQRASDLIKQLLAFSRRASSEPVQIILDDLVNEVVRMLKPLLPSTIELDVSVEDNLPTVLFDITQMQQVLLNLCVNARDAMKGRGRIRIELAVKTVTDERCRSCHEQVDGEYVSIRISDSGTGIPEDKIESIFEPFFTTKSQGEGTGMGLSVVHGIIHKHNSHILIDSVVNAGTIFTLLIPPAELPPVEKKRETEPVSRFTPATSGTNILIVDDEVSLAEFIQEYLENCGYKVTACTDSMQALKLFQAELNNIDLVITDQTMPQLTGMELIRQMRFYRPDIPVILCSGYHDAIDKEDLQGTGSVIYMQKPFNGMELVEKIQQLLH